jgi:hypothetical protein
MPCMPKEIQGYNLDHKQINISYELCAYLNGTVLLVSGCSQHI